MNLNLNLNKIVGIFILFNFVILIIITVFLNLNFVNRFSNPKTHSKNIYIWSKASIGDYFWQHIFEGSISKNINNGYYKYGKLFKYDLKFIFRSGYSLTPFLLKSFLKKKFNEEKFINLILILNGRTKENVALSKIYLDELKLFKNKNLNLGVIMLGNEYCFNNWIINYLERNGGLIKFIFVVYDWIKINNIDIYQWPLGVATYRNFPYFEANSLILKTNRPNLCNFYGTIYNKTSREEIQNLLKTPYYFKKCVSIFRTEWLPGETNISLNNYIDAIRSSDATLNPIGKNHECYRIYEAMSLASQPILEENLNHIKGKKSNCDENSAYRLLKEFKAPVKFITNWTNELNQTLIEISNLTDKEKFIQRISLFTWYEKFKKSLQIRFVKVLKEKFS